MEMFSCIAHTHITSKFECENPSICLDGTREFYRTAFQNNKRLQRYGKVSTDIHSTDTITL